MWGQVPLWLPSVQIVLGMAAFENTPSKLELFSNARPVLSSGPWPSEAEESKRGSSRLRGYILPAFLSLVSNRT